MAQYRRNLILLLVVLCACGHGFAASEKNQKEKPVQFRMFSLFDTISVLYDTDTGTERIFATPNIVSPWFDAPRNGKLNLYRELPSETPGMPKRKETLVDVTLPDGPGPFLIILRKKSDGDGGVAALVLEHSLEAHQPMTYRVFNFSKRRMAVRLADQDMLLEPGKLSVANYPEGRKAWLKIAVDQQDSGWIKVVSRPRPVRDTTRSTLVIMDIPPTEADPDPIGVIVQEVRETIVEGENGPEIQ